MENHRLVAGKEEITMCDMCGGLMFTRTGAIDFAIERGLKGANFVYRRGSLYSPSKMQVYLQGDCVTCLRRAGGGSAEEPTEGRLAEALRNKGSGWFVSAKVDKVWTWFFPNGDEVPHDG